MGGISSAQLVHFTKNLSLMLRSGMTINESLAELSAQASSARFSRILAAVEKDIESGLALSLAMEKHPRVFGGVTLAVVRAGETSGTLEENLNFLSDWLEHNADIAREVHGAMLYPLIVFIATIGVSGALALLVLPRLLPIFAQMQGELPLPTRVLLGATDLVTDHWLLLSLALALLVVGLSALNKIRAVRRFFHGVMLRVPFLGTLLREYQLTLIGQLFATLFRSGLSIQETCAIAARGATNMRYAEALAEIEERLVRGNTLSDGLKAFPRLFPRDMTSIIAVGERSGSLEESFGYITEYYRKEVHAATKRLPTVIEPILLLVMGLLVAFIAIAIILPIYQFTSGVRR